VDVRFGWGRAAELTPMLGRLGVRRPFLVSGDASYRAAGGDGLLGESSGARWVERFDGYATNPRLEDLERGVARLRAGTADAVVGVGGGTAMDLAKAMRLLADQEDEPAAYVCGRHGAAPRPLGRPPSRPLVLLPTTAGTGSEVTPFAVVYAGGVKHSLDHPSLAADGALVDPAASAGMPPPLTAASGLDALCQAVESYWSTRSDRRSRAYAGRAITLALTHLESACRRPERRHRSAMALAATLAGKAIARTRTTGPHALSYPLTARFGIPHGHACALTLPAFLRFNAALSDDDAVDPRGAAAVRRRIADLLRLLGAADADDGSRRLTALVERLGLATRLSRLGVDRPAVDDMAAAGFNPQRMANNPRRVSRDDARCLLLDLL